MYGDPDIASVPDSLLPLVEASLAKDPQSRPTAQQLLDRLTSAASRPGNVNDTPTQVILARTWQSGSHASPPPASRPAERGPGSSSPASGARSLAARGAARPHRRPLRWRLPKRLPPTSRPRPTARRGAGRRGAGRCDARAPEKIPVSRRMATIATSALVAMRLRRPSRQEGPKR